MRDKGKFVLFAALVLLQLFTNRYADILTFSVDFIYLILIFVSVKTTPLKTIIYATLIGWATGYLCGPVSGAIGVFGFARTLSSFGVNSVSRFIDMKKQSFVFFLIMGSLSVSNLIAISFFHFIDPGIDFLNLNMIIFQPVITAVLGILIISSDKMKALLNVY